MQKIKIFCSEAVTHAYHTVNWNQIMRISALAFTGIVLVTHLLIASPGNGQNNSSANISLNLREVSLLKAIKAIKAQTDVAIMYELTPQIKNEKVTINFKNASINDVMDALIRGKKLKWTKQENVIIIEEISDTANIGVDLKSTPSISPSLPPPPITVRGRIVNENGEPVVASVVIKGTNKGTTSNANGEFELSGVNDDAVLIITATNIETVSITAKSVLNIAVKIIASSLNEVVINKGYYSESKKLSTGNVARVDAKTIEKQPVNNPLQAIQGRMPGVYITQNSGVPGASFSIQIRGINSLRSEGNDPLYLIDGVPFTSTTLSNGGLGATIVGLANPLSNINPSDIESIEVLKDADATAIYGSRGSNGVVLITTKKGKAGKTNVDFNVYHGFGEVAHKVKLLTLRQYLDMRYEGYANDGLDFTSSSTPDYKKTDLTIWDTARFTDWQEKLIGGTANFSNAQLSISGGNTNTQFLIKGGYYKESTVFPGDFADKKISTHFNFNHTSDNKKFSVSLSGTYLSDNNNLPRQDLTAAALTLAPNAPKLYDENGKLNWENNTWTNPLQQIMRKYKSNTNNLISYATVGYKIIPDLAVKVRGGYTNILMTESQLNPISSLNPFSSVKTWILEPQAEYQKKLKSSELKLLLGATVQENIRKGYSVAASGFTNDALLENIMAATNFSARSSNYTQYKYGAIFARVNYNYKEKYIINGTVRRDGSSRFGEDKRFANFGAIGAAWIFSNEAFMQTQSVLSFGKFRTSYGTTGSDQILDYQYLDTYSPNYPPYDGGSVLVPTRLANPDYSWELNKKFEAAIDLGFFSDKLLFSANYYLNRCSNQLVGYSLPPTTGFASITYNFPATVQNMGWEFEINSTNVKSRSFSWTSGFNLTIPKNKLLKYQDIEGSSYASTYEVGKSIFTQKRFHVIGVDPATGIYIFQDFNNNGIGTDYPDDLIARKKLGTSYYGGLRNTFSYGHLELEVFFQFVNQTSYDYLVTTFDIAGSFGNKPAEVMNRWRKPGDITSIQKFTQGNNFEVEDAFSNSRYTGDNTIVDASFVRLKNLSLSWQLPSAMKWKIQQMRVFVQGQNLLTFTPYKGFDPEQGFQNLPPLRTIIAGINITL